MSQIASNTIRVPAEIYQEIVKVAEARDSTMLDAFGIWVTRRVNGGVEDALAKRPAKEIVKELVMKCPRCSDPMDRHEYANERKAKYGVLFYCPSLDMKQS